ncbi:NAD(P)/FAD-dependent oxidoreductase [Chelativorans sp. M5D2P16]|uniref:NAD(P)/FAD-dependent oxidoreductase n=1 Tax=Chelativorans sp. M5D2P16 TaxID=3095678 RepID=UPI002ACAB15D|nr:NAD(P)/FAD-dependent oxidoreductase [Chelativorans sp. M5D2P16]MDZ5699515.1 NAD(P)/FAD-dependent oxidoreductase [Chelativorans sp. M5D2P16]
MKTRRETLSLLGAASAAAASLGLPGVARAQAGRVVIVGGGFGGATTAKYLKQHDPGIAVTLVEPAERFYTCPFSNLYLAGLRDFGAIGHGFDELRALGVEVIRDMAGDVDGAAHRVRLAGGAELAYDKLVLSPGIDMRWDAIEGYDATATEEAPHAWKAGAQTRLLRRRLEAMEDGGVFVLVAPSNPFRCPPGPYERASLVANYFKRAKPRSKILILDAKNAFSKQGLFTAGWKELYGDMIEWVSQSDDGRVIRVDAERREVETEFGGRHRADVLNVVPPQKAGLIAERAGVTDESGWVPIEPETFQSRAVPDIHVVGDATVAAPMPKSGFSASAQGKVVAAAIAAMLDGRAPPPPVWTNTCYSLLSPDYGISVAGHYRLADGEIAEVPGAGGLSPADADSAFRRAEARYAAGWYEAITQDIWGRRW